MQSRGIVPVAWWIVGLTTVAIGVLTAITHAKWVGPVMVGVGTAYFVVICARRWRAYRLFDGAIADNRWANFIVFVVGIIYEAMITWFIVGYVLTKGPDPCFCADAQRVHTWFEMVAGGFLYLWFEIAGVYGLAISLYGTLRGRKG